MRVGLLQPCLMPQVIQRVLIGAVFEEPSMKSHRELPQFLLGSERGDFYFFTTPETAHFFLLWSPTLGIK